MYLYEIKVVDKEGDEVRNYDIVSQDIEAALFKANHLIESDTSLDEDFKPYRIKSITEDRVIDSI